MLNTLKSIPNSGIITFVNNRDKSVYVFFSSKLFTQFCTHLYKLREGIHDNDSLQQSFNNDLLDIKTEDVIISIEPTSLRSEYDRITREYISSGYSDMRAGYKASSFKIKKYVLNDFRDEGSRYPLVYVCGTSYSLGDVVLAIFDSIPEADDWIASVYGDKRIGILPVYCDNELTREYRIKYGYEMLGRD